MIENEIEREKGEGVERGNPRYRRRVPIARSLRRAQAVRTDKMAIGFRVNSALVALK